MPNGHDRNWVRICAAIDGFRLRYGRWPTRVRLLPATLADIRENVFRPKDYAKIIAKVDLIPDDSGIIAEDDVGGSYSYGESGFPPSRPDPPAKEWFGIKPKPDKH